MTYPTFRKHGLAFYKLLSEDRYIEVYPPCEFCSGELMLSKGKPIVKQIIREGSHITENQFLYAYVRAIHDIQMEVYPQGMPVINEPAY